MRTKIVASTAFLFFLMLGSANAYVLKHPAREHCKPHYVRRVEKVKRHEHGRTIRFKETVCLHVPAKAAAPKAVAPSTLQPVLGPSAVKLHSHLDPSFVQNPENPLQVTYSYSASASEENQPAILPSGILNLYTDGLLACSMNVGGTTTGGECPVTYGAIGNHSVIVTYSSDLLSATETYTEQIEPYGTTTKVSYSLVGEVLTISAQATGPNGGVAPNVIGGIPWGIEKYNLSGCGETIDLPVQLPDHNGGVELPDGEICSKMTVNYTGTPYGNEMVWLPSSTALAQ